LEKDRTCHPAAAGGFLIVAAELFFQHPVLETEFLFFAQGDGIIALLLAAGPHPVLSGREVAAFERLGRTEKGNAEAAADLRAGILTRHRGIQLVVDPVMIASTGAPLLEKDAVAAYCELLLPMARVITPNLAEAEALLGGWRITDEASLESAARRLAGQFGTAVLLKGGHLQGPDCLDLLVDHGEVCRFSGKRIAVGGSHGTGCTLSAAITAALAHGASLPQAVAQAKDFLGNTLRRSYAFDSPGGGTLHALNQGTIAEKCATE